MRGSSLELNMADVVGPEAGHPRRQHLQQNQPGQGPSNVPQRRPRQRQRPRQRRASPLIRNIRLAYRISVMVAVAALGIGALETIWRRADLAMPTSISQPSLGTIAPRPERGITLLVVGQGEGGQDQRDDQVGFLLARIEPGQALRLLQLPASTPLTLPGRRQATLAQAYGLGGIALVSDSLAETLDTDRVRADRYIEAPIQLLAGMVEQLGGVPVTVEKDLARQGLQLGQASSGRGAATTTPLQQGRQWLQADGVTQYLGFREVQETEAWQLERQRRLLGALRERLRDPALTGPFSNVLEGQLWGRNSNLSLPEVFSLVAASLDPRQGMSLEQLPLDGDGELRRVVVNRWALGDPIVRDAIVLEGSAAQRQRALERLEAASLGPVVERSAPAVPLATTRVVTRGNADDADAVIRALGAGSISEDAPSSTARVTVRLGQDFG